MPLQTCPAFSELDQDLINDFYGSVQEALEEIATCRRMLEQSVTDRELLNRMFRAVHSLKGNCNMMFLPLFVEVTHKLEEIFDDIRKDRYPYDNAFTAFALAALGDVDEQLRALIQNKAFDGEVLSKISKLITPIRQASNDAERVSLAKRVAAAILDRNYELPKATAPDSGAAMSAVTAPMVPVGGGGQTQAGDMEFMSDIASALDSCHPRWHGKVSRELELCKLMNQALQAGIPDEQMTAAVFFHDVGMTWLPAELWKPWDQLSVSEKTMCARHVAWAAGLLRRWPGWQMAALMIEQHHECVDGSGLPFGLTGEAISMGGSLLALADRFYEATTSLADAGYKQSLLGAVKQINALSGRVLPEQVVTTFNSVIRQHYLASARW